MSAIARAEPGWPLRRRQLREVMRAELGRTFSVWRSLWLLMLALAPTVVISGHALHDTRCNLEEETLILGAIVQAYYVRFGVFFGCLWVFMRLVPGEVAERTLHHLFLAPVRRDLLIVGKFLAGVVATVLPFTAGVVASFALMYAHFPAGRDFVAGGPGLAHFQSYLLVTALACVGYGAVFLALSLVFKNPVVPAVIVLVWEGTRPRASRRARCAPIGRVLPHPSALAGEARRADSLNTICLLPERCRPKFGPSRGPQNVAAFF